MEIQGTVILFNDLAKKKGSIHALLNRRKQTVYTIHSLHTSLKFLKVYIVNFQSVTTKRIPL